MRRPRILLPLILFVLSGGCGLVYELAWTRSLTLSLGSSTLAVSTVVSVFMGGLAIGSRWAGRRVATLSRPLRAYGVLELLIGLYAFSTPALFGFFFPLVDALAARMSESFLALSVLRFLAAAVVLLPPTVLMGTTLPVLAQACAAGARDAGRVGGLLYAANLLGAVAGTLLAGFFLLPTHGLGRTVLETSVLNLVLAVIAIRAGGAGDAVPEVSRVTEDPDRALPAPDGEAPIPQGSFEAAPADRVGERARRDVLVAVALTGFAAMVCQVAWTRILCLLLGGSVYAFTAVLSVFLTGLAIGAAVIAAWSPAGALDPRLVFHLLGTGAAALICIASAAFADLPDLYVRLYFDWNMERNFGGVLAAQFLITAIVLLPPAILMGGLFPMAARVLIRDAPSTGPNLGRLYAWNTAGAIGGAVLASFVLIPAAGLRAALLLAAGLQCAASILVIRDLSPRLLAGIFSAFSTALFALMVVGMPAWDRQLMTRGMFEYADRYRQAKSGTIKTHLATDEELVYYADGMTATVTVSRRRGVPDGAMSIRTNGKVDGSTGEDMDTQRLLAHLPLLFHPAPREVCVIGMGTGCTAGSAALHRSAHVTVVEIEAAMVEGARLFNGMNHDIHRRAKLVVTDGRHYLGLHPRAFDVVISEPSNPWLAGCADLFTVESFRRASGALREGGLFCQWVQMYGLSPESVRLIARSFLEVFPCAYLAVTRAGSDLVLLGSATPFTLDLERAAARINEEREIVADLEDPRVGIHCVHHLASRIRLGPAELRAFAGAGPLNTDDLQRLAYEAIREKYQSTGKANEEQIGRVARGVGPYLGPLHGSLDERRHCFTELAELYRQRAPGTAEAGVCEELAKGVASRPGGQ